MSDFGGGSSSELFVWDEGRPTAVASGMNDDAPWPSRLAGVLVRVVPEDFVHGYAERLSVRCPNPDHRKCHVSRSVKMDVAAFGPTGVLDWLQCWLADAFLVTEEQHRQFKPTVADVRAWRATRDAVA